ncbi:MAG: TldD/PmbA family protein, partial [Promethearchaeota archaeon]
RSISGIGVRVLKYGWGFVSEDNIDEILLKKLISKALKIAQFSEMSQRRRIPWQEIDTQRKTHVYLPKQKDVASFEQLLEQGKELLSELELDSNELVDLQLTQDFIIQQLQCSEGSQILQEKSSLLLEFQVQIDTTPVTVLNRKTGILGSFEDLNRQEVNEVVRDSVVAARDLQKAKVISPCTSSIVMGASPAWLITHEAIGHAFEGDSIINERSVFSGQLGKKVASEIVTIVDDPSVSGMGSYAFDDEGTKASGTVLIEEGILTDFLHNRETAATLNTKSTANARAHDYRSFPIVRMSNIYIEPGDWSFEELLEGDGIYIADASRGSADLVSGEFRLAVDLAYEIKDGELGKPLRGFTLVDNMFSFLSRIEAIGSNVSMTSGICGKENQIILQGALAPAIRVSELRLVI